MIKQKAVVCLSGGQDSTTVLAIADSMDRELYALSVDYGQKHMRELECAHYQAKAFKVVEHREVSLLGMDFNSALTQIGNEIPSGWDVATQGPPPTIVPGRNAILFALAASWASSLGADEVWTGVCQTDYSGYPDCRQEFVNNFTAACREGLDNYNFQIVTPLMGLTKCEMIEQGTELGVDWAHTWTCYKGDKLACGVCPACRLRLQGFYEFGLMRDPLEYAVYKKES